MRVWTGPVGLGRAVLMVATLSGCALEVEPIAFAGRRAVEGGASGGAVNAGSGGTGFSGGAGFGGTTASAGAGACPAGVCSDAAAVMAGSCGAQASGVFGALISTEVAWGGRNEGLAKLTEDGRGRILVYLRVAIGELAPDGSFRADVKPCHVELPAFYSSILCEAYQAIFPHSLWESPSLPELSLEGRYECLEPECRVHFDPLTALLGIERDDPDAPWPPATLTQSLPCAAGSGEDCFPDHDTDQRAGITVHVRKEGKAPGTQSCSSGYNYRPPPLSANPAAIFDGVERAEHIFLGARTRLGGFVELGADCARGFGPAVADGFFSRAIGCGVQFGSFNFPNFPAPPGKLCEDDQVAFMDQNLPEYTVLGAGATPSPALQLADTSASAGPTLSLVRLGELGQAVTCADVRNASY